MIGYEDNRKLTAKQVGGMDRVERVLLESHGISEGWLWDFVYAEEVRPGRGHDARFYGLGDDLMVGGHVDVHGNFDYWIADLTIVHSSADDECPCTPCKESEELEDADG